VDIVSIEDPADQSTGNFSISVNGQLIHCKTSGDGDWNTKPKQQKVFAAVEEELERHSTGNDPLLQKLLVQESPEEEDQPSNRSVIVSLCTLVLSIPALIGA